MQEQRKRFEQSELKRVAFCWPETQCVTAKGQDEHRGISILSLFSGLVMVVDFWIDCSSSSPGCWGAIALVAVSGESWDFKQNIPRRYSYWYCWRVGV